MKQTERKGRVVNKDNALSIVGSLHTMFLVGKCSLMIKICLKNLFIFQSAHIFWEKNIFHTSLKICTVNISWDEQLHYCTWQSSQLISKIFHSLPSWLCWYLTVFTNIGEHFKYWRFLKSMWNPNLERK